MPPRDRSQSDDDGETTDRFDDRSTTDSTGNKRTDSDAHSTTDSTEWTTDESDNKSNSAVNDSCEDPVSSSVASDSGSHDDSDGLSASPVDSDPSGPEGLSEVEFEPDRTTFERFRHDYAGPMMWIRELLFSVAIVLLLGLLLFAVSGAWPPMVAVESGSMEPNLEVGDLVFVTEPGRFAPDAATSDIGVVTEETGQQVGYQSFGTYGSVIIFQPPDRTASPIIHRAMFHVEADENWYDRADDRFHGAADCTDLRHCPAPHDGYITLGDNNGQYDQASGLAEPVKADWVTGVARLRVPYLGYIRLLVTGQVELGELLFVSMSIDPAVESSLERAVTPVG